MVAIDSGENVPKSLGRLQAALHKLQFGDTTIPVAFVRNPKARRYILRMGANGAARVTIPRGGSMDYANRFVEKNRAWIARQMTKAPAAWGNGTAVLLRGAPQALTVEPDGTIKLGDYWLGVARGDLRAHVESCLRVIAEPELKQATERRAREVGLTFAAVRVRNQRTRWGSCSSKRVINLNWRLIQTPEFVRDYIIVHELMHLREMNHSIRFWKHVSEAFPRWKEAERWLRENSGLLR